MFDSCSHCKQTLMIIGSCSCRNYKVWDIEHEESEATTITRARSFQHAAEEYVERLEVTSDCSFTLMVKNFREEIKKVRVDATVKIDLESEIEDIEEKSA